jgi:uncharacterized protein (TIGR03437 family)
MISIFARFTLFSLFVGACPAQNTWYIDTIAGNGQLVSGEGGPAIAVRLGSPAAIVQDATGAFVFTDPVDHLVRRIDAKGVLSTIAGTGKRGFSGDGGPALSANLDQPQGLAYDSKGNLYIADPGSSVVRRVTPDGVISTFAGNGVRGFAIAGNAARSTPLNLPFALAFDSQGQLYIGEGSAVQIVSADGRIAPLTVGAVGPPVQEVRGLAFDAGGNLYISSFGSNRILSVSKSGVLAYLAGDITSGFNGDGVPASQATLNGPSGLVVDSAGSLLFADTGNNRIRRIGPDGVITTVAGSGSVNYNVDGSSPLVLSVNGPSGIGVDSAGNIFWTESAGRLVRRLTNGNKSVLTIGGSAGPSSSAQPATSLRLRDPSGVTTAPDGFWYIADTNNHVVLSVDATGSASVLVGTGQAGLNGDRANGTATMLNRPAGLTVANGNVYIADAGNARIRAVSIASGVASVFLGGGNVSVIGSPTGFAGLVSPGGVKVGSDGGLTVTDAGLNAVLHTGVYGNTLLAGPNSIFPFDGMGNPTAKDGGLVRPMNAIVTRSGVLIADTGNHSLKKASSVLNRIPPAVPSPVAGYGRADSSGDGGLATAAGLWSPSDVALDSTGNIFIADAGNNRIRMIDTAGRISTIAGTGAAGFSGDKGLATNAQLNGPSAISFDLAGNILVADQGNQRIRILRYQALQDFTVASGSDKFIVNRGSSVTIPFSLLPGNGFVGPVELSVSGPAGVVLKLQSSSPVSFLSAHALTVNVVADVPADISAGPATITLTAVAGTLKHTATAGLTITNRPQFTAPAVLNAASFAAGPVAPGEIVVIYGRDFGPAALELGKFDLIGFLASQVAGTRVLFDQTAAPVLYSVAGQVAVIVPYEVAGKAATSVRIEQTGQVSDSVSLAVTGAAPALFGLSQGTQAAALNQDFSVNSEANPASAGSIVVLFGTGEGMTMPGGVNGKRADKVLPAPMLPVAVTIDGRSAEVLYAGAAPGQTAGVIQINVRLPGDLRAGVVPVAVTVGNQSSTGKSTLAVR